MVAAFCMNPVTFIWSSSVKLLTIPNNNNLKKWIALHLVFELTHLFENKEPFNSCFYLNGQPYDLDTKRNERETLNLRGGRKKLSEWTLQWSIESDWSWDSTKRTIPVINWKGAPKWTARSVKWTWKTEITV